MRQSWFTVMKCKGFLKYMVAVGSRPYVFYRSLLNALKKKRILSRTNDPALVFHQDMTEVTALENCGEERCLTLPCSLVIQPNKYQFKSICFNCHEPGIYRFANPQYENRQHLILDVNDPIASVMFVALTCMRGNRDDNLNHSTLECIAQTRFLVMTCGPLVAFAHNLLSQYGIQSRIVHAHTIESLNTYDNGHTMLEVWSEVLSKYVVVDLDKKCIFQRQGIPLSLYEYSNALRTQKEVIYQWATSAIMIDWIGYNERATRYDYSFIEYAVHATQNGRESSLERICQVPIFYEGGFAYACAWNEECKLAVDSHSTKLVALQPEDFFERFYRK